MNHRFDDEDEYQEYQCLLLEGHDDEEARSLARGARDAVNRGRLSGPRSSDSKGHGLRPYITNTRKLEYERFASVSFTMDSRTDEEREQDCRSSDFARELLSRLTDRQRETVDLVYGVTTGTPMTYMEAAHHMGCTYNQVEWAVRSGVDALRDHTDTTAAERRKAKRRERARKRYASQKMAVEGKAVRSYSSG